MWLMGRITEYVNILIECDSVSLNLLQKGEFPLLFGYSTQNGLFQLVIKYKAKHHI